MIDIGQIPLADFFRNDKKSTKLQINCSAFKVYALQKYNLQVWNNTYLQKHDKWTQMNTNATTQQK